MSPLSLSRPGPDESAAFYHGYIDKVPGEQIGTYLADQPREMERLLASLDDAGGRTRYAPGKWSVKEVLGHLCDAERIFAYRLLRIARADSTPLPGFDENAYVPPAEFDARPLPHLLREFQALRASTIELVEGLPAAAWERRGQASGKSISTRAIAYIIVGHVTHHLGVLRERYGLSSSPGAMAAV
ncbi:MAG TPA: DinB family protein [Gemmatimonadales bacterium]|nr:DinB family protein [Gemmatimonadales bacterium]